MKTIRKQLHILFCFVLLFVILLYGCLDTTSLRETEEVISKEGQGTSSITEQSEKYNPNDSEINELPASTTEETEISNDDDREAVASVSETTDEFCISQIEKYSDKPYTIVNDNMPFFKEQDLSTLPFEEYSKLDSLGRCGVTFANVCKEIMPTEKRGEIGFIRPSGWKTVKYNGVIDGNYLYNRCHLIGYQLAGENANECNLITGTRYLNVEGMLPFENEVADYVRQNSNHVLYRVTPIFEDSNLVASGVLMEAKSVEDKGAGVCFCVFVYNVQPGVQIDYATGDSQLIEGWSVDGKDKDPVTKETLEQEKVENAENNKLENNDINANENEQDKDFSSDKDEHNNNEDNTTSQNHYIINTNTGKFHCSNCSSVSQMKEKNKMEYDGTRDEVINMGYKPCKNCNP